MWYDVTHGFGSKWKDLFIDLEANCGLDVNNLTHIWLLHWLFLDAINQDATTWAEAWNNHKMQIRREHQKSPTEMFFLSIYEDGPRGIFDRDPFHIGPLNMREGEEEDVGEDVAAYGVDWEEIDNEQIMENHYQCNPPQHAPLQPNNPFANAPPTLSEVICTPPNCPLSDEQTNQLRLRLSLSVDLTSHNMLVRRTVWIEALRICTYLL